eukprot:Phypoly_transcript_08077.p1 GENE.Phypoly_transcript_08077~~Phypoly_transcript_08077.p1  ORF type:complete len:136 (+),score=29.37 Phypoly_transcript_08077:778-1185(+)
MWRLAEAHNLQRVLDPSILGRDKGHSVFVYKLKTNILQQGSGRERGKGKEERRKKKEERGKRKVESGKWKVESGKWQETLGKGGSNRSNSHFKEVLREPKVERTPKNRNWNQNPKSKAGTGVLKPKVQSRKQSRT